jgi:hypothetical protein
MKHLNLSSLGVLIYFALLLSNVSVFGQNTDDGKPKISFQGVLKTASGEPVPDAEYSFVFSFWRSKDGTANTDKLPKAGSTEQWIESVSLSVEGGIYSHNLGSITDLNPENFNGPVYLNIKVGGKDILPRTEFTYSPFSFSVATAQKVACSGAVGDIKYSILPPDKFKNVNGSCWVPLDGRTLSDSDQLYLQGVTQLPNAGGMFLRSQDFNAVSGTESWKPRNSSNNDPDRDHTSGIGSYQGYTMESHAHNGVTSYDGVHQHRIDNIFVRGNESGGSGSDQWTIANQQVDDQGVKTSYFTTYEGGHSHTFVTYSTGGSETRPINLNFWIYIRIN